MSLPNSPSLRSEWKLRLEIFLSTCWRIYSSGEKYFYRRKRCGSLDKRAIKITAQAAELYLKYSGTMKVHYLAAAVEKYWEVKNYPRIAETGGDSSYVLFLEGFAEGASKKVLCRSISQALLGRNAKLKIERRKFRPDVAYRVEGDFGLWSGFRVQVQSEDLALVRQVSAIIEKLVSSGAIDAYRFHVLDAKRDGVENSISRIIGEMLPLIEAACDRDMARKVSNNLLRIEAASQLHCSSQDLAKLFLIAQLPFPEILLSQGWRTLHVADPVWHPFQQFEANNASQARHSIKGHESDSHIPMPPPSLAILENVLVTDGDVLTRDNQLFGIDPSANPAFSFVAGHQDIVVGTSANMATVAVRVPNSEKHLISEGILLSSRADTNWFHWLIETLPKLLYLDSEVASDVPILVSDRIPKSAKESIGLVSKRTVVEISSSRGTLVSSLYVCSPVLFHPDPVELHLSPATNAINLEALSRLRTVILSASISASSNIPKPDSIFVSRSSGARALINSRRVTRVLSRLGFSTINPLDMSLSEQVLAFNSASRIVLVGGASMANLIFCSPGAAVVILSSRFTVGYKMPEMLASVAGAKVLAISGRPVGNFFRGSYLEKIHAHYQVRIGDLKMALSDIRPPNNG